MRRRLAGRIARYGYKDMRKEDHKDMRKEDHRAFEMLLVQSLEGFLKKEALELSMEGNLHGIDLDRVRSDDDDDDDNGGIVEENNRVPLLRGEDFSELPASVMVGEDVDPGLEYELAELREASESGFTYLLGDGDVRATKESFFVKKLVVNYFYAFLRRNCRGGAATMRVPHMNIMRVKMTSLV